jgi:polyisoprenoid-binding protein YceI
MKHPSPYLVFITCLFVTAFANAQSKTLWAEKDKSYIQYTMHHSLHDFSGKDNNINCVIAYDPAASVIQKVSVSANISDFNSGSGNRDSHAMEVLEAIKYPKVKFNSNKIDKQGNKLIITGLLTFHGVTKEIKIEATEELNSNKMKVLGSFKVSQEAFNIKRETFMMVPVDDIINIDFEVNFSL